MVLIPLSEKAILAWDNSHISIADKKLGKVSVYKYVWVDLNSSLSVNDMIDTIYNKVYKKVSLVFIRKLHN